MDHKGALSVGKPHQPDEQHKQQQEEEKEVSLPAKCTPLLAVFPSARCKTIHMIRHGQGEHNVVGEKDHGAYKRWDFLDCCLTPLGHQQVASLRQQLLESSSGAFRVQTGTSRGPIEVVISSPLMRTLQTAVGVFGPPASSFGQTDVATSAHTLSASAGGEEGSSNGTFIADGGSVDGFGESLEENSGARGATWPPIVAHELCRETMHVHPCDKRRSVREYKKLFPHVDFSEITSEEDELWRAEGPRETKDECILRARSFLHWVLSRPELNIAVVSHSAFLRNLLWGCALETFVPSTQEGYNVVPFKNCELRSFVIMSL